MRIEIFQDAGKQQWYWHFRARNGRITANNEAFPTKAHAIRAAKDVVKAIAKCYGVRADFERPATKGGVTVIFI